MINICVFDKIIYELISEEKKYYFLDLNQDDDIKYIFFVFENDSKSIL